MPYAVIRRIIKRLTDRSAEQGKRLYYVKITYIFKQDEIKLFDF